jgi:hypothetical protein
MRRLPEFAVLLGVSFVVGFADEISHGRYLGPALACLALALAVLTWRFVAGIAAPAPAPAPAPASAVTLGIWVVVTSMPVTALLDPKILAHPHSSLWMLRALEVASILLLTTYLPFIASGADTPLVRRVRFAAFAAVTLAGGVAILHISPAPTIDVWDLQMHGARALLRGENPYVTVTVPDTTPIHPFPYVPFVYAPGTLYAGVIGLLIGGDVRYAMLIALGLAGLALRAIARPPPHASTPALASLVEDAPALFVWLMPPLAFILELGWTDPIQLGLICVGVATALRGRSLLGAMVFGLAATSKQTMCWMIPLAGFALGYRPREWLALLGVLALGVGPFAIANFGALKYDTFDLIRGLVPRADSLGFAVWYQATFGHAFPTVVSTLGALATIGATAYGARSLGRGPAPANLLAMRASLFGRAAALTYFVYFFFAKQAFANYYFLVAGLAALAGATALRSQGLRPLAPQRTHSMRTFV